MTNDSISKLQDAAQNGDIDLLYTVIHEDQFVLEHIDVIPFVDTPLHIAAAAGHLQFASEIIRLKPSFALKLNKQGFSPIHLSLQQGQETMVKRLVDINKDLIRVKGREGLTPLHFVSQIGEIDLLVKFLSACPDSIEDVTARSETALHIAVKNRQHEALRVLVGWLKKTDRKGAMDLENTILNRKDEEGNTILHISALINDSEAFGLLKKSRIDLWAKNLKNSTALDIATIGDLRGSSVTYARTLADILRSNITELLIFISRIGEHISEDKRNAFLVVATLVVTATYQAALSPPGGVYQADAGDNTLINLYQTHAGDNNMKVLKTFFRWLNDTKTKTGKSVMTRDVFLNFWSFNTASFLFSTGIIYFLTPSVRGIVGSQLFTPILYFPISYFYSMMVISPTPRERIVNFMMTSFFISLGCLVILIYVIVLFIRMFKRGGKIIKNIRP